MTATIVTSPATTVSVRGEADLDVDPDYATISFSVETDASTAPKALERAARIADACRATLADAAGVHHARLGRVRVRERRHWSEKQDRWISDGHAASVSGSTDVATADVGGTVAALVAVGAQVGWVGWALNEDNPAYREVRKLAVADAHRAAVDFADAIGTTLGALVTLADPGLLGAGVPDRYERMQVHASASVVPDADELELDPEQQNVAARVEACFSLE
jgi:uncharacterized protein YggE